MPCLGGAKGMGIFGGGGNNRSNRLYRALVDTELAVAVGSSFRPTIDPDLFTFYVTLGPRRHAIKQVEDAIWGEITRIQQEGVHPPSWTRPSSRPRPSSPTAAKASPTRPIGSALAKSSPAWSGSTTGWTT